MFTGIVQAVGRISFLERRDFGVRLRIDRTGWEARLPKPGDSIAISGVCLTVVEATEKMLAFDVIPQTLTMTSLGDKDVGDSVNLEPALVAGDPMGGHVVQGHIDGIAKVIEIERSEEGHRVTLRPVPGAVPGAAPGAVPGAGDLMNYIVWRGSITLDGVSLTIAEVTQDTFTVALIPTTLDITTFGEMKVGDHINVETDILTRTIVHRLERQAQSPSTLDIDLLRAAGFMA